MAEYLRKTAIEDRWEKMHTRGDAIFGKIMAKLEILLQLSSHGATNSFKELQASKSLNVVMPTRDEFLPFVEQIKIPSPCAQSLLVDAVTPTSDLIEDVMDLPATTTITTLTETTELFAGHNISIDQVEFSLSTESVDTLLVTDEESVGQLDTDDSFLVIQGSHPKRGLQFNQMDLESSTEPIHLISSQEPQDRKTNLEWICRTKLPCLGIMRTDSIQKCLSRVRRNVSMQSRPLKPPDRNHHTMANPPPPPEPPDMSSHVFVITFPMIAKVLKFSTSFITLGKNFVWPADMLAILHDIEKSSIQNNSLSVGSCLMECIKSLPEKHKIMWGLSIGWVLFISYDFICVIGSKYLVLAATHRCVIHAYKLFVKFPYRDVVIWSTLVKSGTSFCSTNVAPYFFMVMVLKGDHYTLFVFGLSDIHFSNYNVCNDVELVSTETLSHVKGSLQISNESIDTKLRHQATQLCGNTTQLIEKLQATLNTNVLLYNCGLYDMSNMILDCSHSLILEHVKTCLLERKLLQSFELVSKSWMVVVMQVDYGDFDLMSLNCGCVYCVWFHDNWGTIKLTEIMSSRKSKKLDPGGCSLVHKEGMLNLELTLGVTTLIQQHYLNFNLEDKVDFKGDGNVMINDLLTSCLFTNMLYIEEIICDIKVGEVEMMERIRHKKMLLSSSWNDALEFYHVQIMDPLEVTSLNSQIFLTEMVNTSIWTICNQFLNLCVRFKQWDPGQHLEMCKTMWSFKFKQWDPGKICAVNNFHNLEDKVAFNGDGIVMSQIEEMF